MAEKRRKSATLPHYWTPDQIGQIIAAIPPGPHKLLALTLWRTGLRCAEALTWSGATYAWAISRW